MMKQKKYSKLIIALIGLGVINVAVATDYSSLSTEELIQMRSQTRDMSSEDHESYRTEVRTRMQSISTEDRANYQQMNGQGSGNGSGNQYRYGQGSGDGGGSYGSGYGSRQGGGGRHR